MRLAVASGIVLAGNLMPALAVAQEEGRYYGHHMWDGGWGGMFFGPFFMILLVVVVVAAVVIVLRWQGGPPPHHGTPGKTPLDILKERYARGEIDKEEFEERRRVLGD